MSLEEQAGQLIMVDLEGGAANATIDALLTDRGVGGVVYLGNSWNRDNATKVGDHLLDLPNAHGIKPFIGVDQEGGEIQRLSTGFEKIPAATTQGTWDVERLTGQATGWGEQLASVGVNVNFAPVADTVPEDQKRTNQPIGVLNREFGSDPQEVGEHAAAFVAGMNAAKMGSAVKHFPGLGRVRGNTDFTAEGIVDTVTTADDPYLDAFATAMAADPTMVMISLATYEKIDPDNPAAFSSAVITDLLRGQMGWNKLVISDSFGAAAVAGVPAGERGVQFIEAGGDVVMITTAADATAALDGIIARAQSDADFAAQVTASARRVLEAKENLGLLTAR
jgi:beta-N-acetylhexosaminidase